MKSIALIGYSSVLAATHLDRDSAMPVCPEAYTPQPAREGEFTYYPNAVMAFTALRKYHGIWDLGPMTLGGDFGQDEKQDHPEGCAGMGSENEAGVCFTFYNDGRVCVYLPKA